MYKRQEIFGKVLQTLQFLMNLRAAMFIHTLNAKIALQSFTAAEAVPQMNITQQEALTEYMNLAVNYTENELNVPLCLKLPRLKKS